MSEEEISRVNNKIAQLRLEVDILNRSKREEDNTRDTVYKTIGVMVAVGIVILNATYLSTGIWQTLRR